MIAELVWPELLEQLATYVHARMRRHITPVVHPRLPTLGAVVANCSLQIILHKSYVCINSIYPPPFYTFYTAKSPHNMGKRILRLEHVVRIQNPHYVPCRHLDSLVDGIVHAFVTLGEPAKFKPCRTCRACRIFFYDIHRSVL